MRLPTAAVALLAVAALSAQEQVLPVHELETVASPWLAEFPVPQFEARELSGVATVRRTNGSVLALFSNQNLNARDPFARIRAPYRLLENENAIAISPTRWWNVQAKTTYTSRRSISVVNAVGFDGEFQNRLPLQEVFQTPTRSLILEPSMEFRIGSAHRLAVDYVYDRWAADDAGAGGLALKTRAIDERNLQRNGILTWYWEPGGRWISILSAYLGRNRFSRRPSPKDPSVEVQGALLIGAPQLENEAHSHSSERYNAAWSVLAEDHEIKFGAEARFLRGENISRKNFNPLLSFAGGIAPQLDGDLNIVGKRLTVIDSLERFRRTALLLRTGLPDEEILARGGGASLFSISGGDPFARLRQWEYNAYLQDVWQLRPWVLLSLGVRFQTQAGVRNDRAFGPRFGLSWGLRGGGSTPRQVIRFGAGLFHEGFNEDLRLNTIRYNGLNQRVFVVQRPGAVLLPSFPQLVEGNRYGLVQRSDPRLRLPRLFDAAAGWERRWGATWILAASFRLQDGKGQFRNLSANTIEEGETGRPLPPPFDNVYIYQSNGRFRLYDFQVRASGGRRIAWQAVYDYARAFSDTDGPASFPADRRNLAAEYGRAATDIRHTAYVSAVTRFLKRWTVDVSFGTRAGAPFNFITGRDVHGDGVFVERPGLASENDPDAVQTPYGSITPEPLPGMPRLPRNVGQGPWLLTVNSRIGYTFPLAGKSSALTLEGRVWNATNFVNLAKPEGNMASPFFLRSAATIGSYGGIPEQAGNRVIEVGARFVF